MGPKSTLGMSLFLFCLIPALAASQTYTVTDLGPLAPTGINTWAQVVGNYNNQAYIWSFGHLQALGTLPGGTFSQAAAINDLGVVTGTADGLGTVTSPYPSIAPNQQCSDLTQPFVWTQRNGMQGLGTLGLNQLFFPLNACGLPFYGSGTNDLGEVVGYTPVLNDFYVFGFQWTSANGMSVFGSSWPPTFINAISNTGLIVGQNGFPIFIGNATSWKNGVGTDLGTLGGGDDTDYSSAANGANDLGQIVGWSTTTPIVATDFGGWTGDTPIHALLWSASGAIDDLGTLPGDTFSAASKINLLGLVIGVSGNAVAAPTNEDWRYEIVGRPFIWSAHSGMQDLNTLIPADSGWVLNSAAGINIWGQIVGQGTLDGETHGFLLTPKLF